VQTPPPYPASRPRRLRRDAFTRALVREHRLSPADLILPVFVLDGQRRCRTWPRCPACSAAAWTAVRRWPKTACAGHAGDGAVPGHRASLKTPDGREATNPEGLVPRAVRALKQRFPELGC
jgi:porphobilinogen synthase